MPRPKSVIPRLCRNAKGYLFAKNSVGKQEYFGHESDPDSLQKYAAFLSHVQQTPDGLAGQLTKACSVNEVCLAFVTKYAPRYRDASGKPSAELDCFKSAIRVLRPLFGESVAKDFGPLRLRTVRDAMVAEGWCRNFINKQVRRIRMMFRFAISLELIPATVLAGLDSLPPLAEGETSAPDYEPRTAVSDEDLIAVREALNEYNRDVLDLMLLTGARPGEILLLTGAMIEQSDDVWKAKLKSHKNAKRGKSRTLFFNQTAQVILRRHLTSDLNARLFPTRRDTFSKTLQRTCLKIGVTPFCPHQLRHTVATRLDDGLGLEAAQRVLGHSNSAMTSLYTRAADRQAIEAVRSLK